MYNKFDTQKVWETLLRDESHSDKLTLFMAVPTVYYNLIKHYEDELVKTKDKDEIKSKL